MLVEYDETGKLTWENVQADFTYELTPYFRAIADEYLSVSELYPNTRNDDDARWVTHEYFSWLSENGCSDLSSADISTVQQFAAIKAFINYAAAMDITVVISYFFTCC